MTVKTYRKKPLEIQAVQLRWSTWQDVCEFVGDQISEENPARLIPESEVSDTCGENRNDPNAQFIALDLETTHGDTATFRHGDWIVPDERPGTFYPIKPDVFKRTYEPVDESDEV